MFVPPRLRYRLFVDETGTQDLKAAQNVDNERYLSLTGLVIRQDIHDGPLTARLNKLKSDLFGHSTANPVVLHRREVLRREGAFKVLDDEYARAEFDARMTALIAEAQFMAVTVSIDKRAHLEKYRIWQHDPYHYCLECMLERFTRWLSRKGFQGDVMAEARNPDPDRRLIAAYKHFYNNGTDYVRKSVVQSRLLTRELKLATKSHDVAGLQMADALAHPALISMRHARNGTEHPDSYGKRLIHIVEKYKYDRHPNSGVILGVGRKWLP
jgi:hypothetical protein